MEMNFNSQLSNSVDEVVKGVPKNSHSTDTEPEAENCNNNNKCSQICLTSNGQFQNCTNIKGKAKVKNVFEDFINVLPSYEYDQQQIRKNQLKKKRMEQCKEKKQMSLIDTNNNRFLNYYEAFLYIAEHCMKNNQKFTRETCKQYLKQCYIIDFAHDNFIPITKHLSQKMFNNYFRLSQREIKYI